MDNDRIEALGHQAKGAVKHAVGGMIGETKTQADGAARGSARDAAEKAE